MSGLLALLNTDRAPVDVALLSELTAAMAFRGPDARSTWAGDHVGLGHTLFRSTFESAGESQPFSLDGDVWIAADARVDGRSALVQRLRERGRTVAGDAPDVELVLHAYLAWGDACLDHLIGDFAFVLWDGRRARLLAARDQLGVAQLFYAQARDTLIVGNTLQSLLSHPAVPDTLDDTTLADVALFTMPLDDAATGYKAVRRLPPGHTLTWDRQRLRVARYWTVHEPATTLRHHTSHDHAEEFLSLFDQAVADRLRTDRVGSQLSGGMDSTSIAVTASRWLQGNGRPFDMRAYTIDHRSLVPDEEGMLAEQVAGHAGFPIEVLSGEAYMSAEPAADPGWIPPEPGAATYRGMREICRRTAEFAPVLLTGYGGDPLLHAPPLSWHRAWAALRQGSWRWPVRSAVARWRRRRPQPLPDWVSPEWARAADLDERASRFRRLSRPDQVGLAEAPVWRALFAWSDAGYNGLALDIRFPFFDLRLVELVLAIPPTPWLEAKRLLRDAMGDRLPDVVRTRPKTLMTGNVTLEHTRDVGAPAWELDQVAAPEMAAYIDQDWLRGLRGQPAEMQARTWVTQRPPVQLAYWLRHRPRWDGVSRQVKDSVPTRRQPCRNPTRQP